MKIIEIILISLSLASDAFVSSVSKGMSLKRVSFSYAFIIALFFGGFQFIMPIIGYYMSNSFYIYISYIDHYLAFILLGFLGINMIIDKNDDDNEELTLKNILYLSVATSIDALVIGITFAFLNKSIFIPSIIIGVITFITSFIGVILGNKINNIFGLYSKKIGGLVLILMGLKILIVDLTCQ